MHLHMIFIGMLVHGKAQVIITITIYTLITIMEFMEIV